MVENVNVTEETKLDTPPEVAGEIAQDPDIAGALTPEELNQLRFYQQKGSQLTMEIGNIEVRKARLLGTLSDLEGQAQALLDAASVRMGIEAGQPWQVLPDGRARLLRNVTQMPQG